MMTITEAEWAILRDAQVKAAEVMKGAEKIAHDLVLARKQHPTCVAIVEALAWHQALLLEARRDMRLLESTIVTIEARYSATKSPVIANGKTCPDCRSPRLGQDGDKLRCVDCGRVLM